MQTSKGMRFGSHMYFGLVLLVALAVLLQPVGSYAAPQGADTVVYVVKPGDTLRSIAAAHGTTISAIVSANKMANPDVIYPGQRLMIPAAWRQRAPTNTRCASPGPGTHCGHSSGRRCQRLSHREAGRHSG